MTHPHQVHPAKVDSQRNAWAVRAYELRLTGAPLRAVAKQLTDEGFKCSHETVRVLVKEESDRRLLPLVDEFIKQSLDRLDAGTFAAMKSLAAAQLVLDKAIEQGSSGSVLKAVETIAKAVEGLVRVENQRGMFLGANKMAAEWSGKMTVEGEVVHQVETEADRELRDLVAQVKANGAQAVTDDLLGRVNETPA